MTEIDARRNPTADRIGAGVPPPQRYLALLLWVLDWLRAQGVADAEGLLWPLDLPRQPAATLQRVHERRPISEQERAELIEVFVGMAPQIHRMIRSRAPADTVEDLAHEVLRRALERRHAFDATRGTIAGWMWGIALTVIREYWSRPARREVPGDVPEASVEAASARTRLADLGPVVAEFFAVIDAMPPEQRAIYAAVDLEGCSPWALADALRWNRNVASSRLRLARERVAEARTRWKVRGWL